MKLNYETLNARVCVMRAEAALVDYIYRVQGAEARRLDYNAAASSLGISRRTVGRYVKILAAQNVLEWVRKGDIWALRLNSEIISE